MKSCGNPKAYMAMFMGIILMVITVYLTIELSQYMVRVEDARAGGTGGVMTMQTY